MYIYGLKNKRIELLMVYIATLLTLNYFDECRELLGLSAVYLETRNNNN